MSVVHLNTPGDHSLCGRSLWSGNQSGALADMTCKFCTRGLEGEREWQDAAAWQRRYMAEAKANCDAAGLGEAWERLADIGDDMPAIEMVRDVLASVAKFLVELDAEASEVAA